MACRLKHRPPTERIMVSPQVFARLVLLSCWMTLSLSAQAADSVSWMSEDSPPFYIYQGPLAGQGAGDLALGQIFARLPSFDHRRSEASIARIFHEMQYRDGVCYLGALRDPTREAFARFNRRPILLPSFRVLIEKSHRGEMAPFLTQNGEVDLSALAGSASLRGGYRLGTPYPGVLGRFIDNPDRKTRLDPILTVKQMNSMLSAGNIDFYVEDGIAVRYYTAGRPLDNSLLSLRIAGLPPTIATYIACSDRPVGRAVVAQLDRLFEDDRVWADFLAPFGRWLEAADFAMALAARSVSD